MTQDNEIQDIIGESPKELDSFWLDVAQNMVKESIPALEEAGKQVIGTASLLQGIYFAAISFSELKKLIIIHSIYDLPFAFLFVSPIISWLFSVALATRIYKPETYYTNLLSPDLAFQTYCEMVNYKHKYLSYAYWTLILGFILLIINILIYFGLSPPASQSSIT